MLESPVSLSTLSSLEVKKNETQKCYADLARALQKLSDAGMALCKAQQAVTTCLKAPILSSGGGQVETISSELEAVGALLGSLYSQLGRKPSLDERSAAMAEKRRAYEAAMKRHQEGLQRACTHKIPTSVEERQKLVACDHEARCFKHDSEVKRLEWRQSLEMGTVGVRAEHAKMVAHTLGAHASTYKAALVKLEAIQPAIASLQDTLAADQLALGESHRAELDAADEKKRATESGAAPTVPSTPEATGAALRKEGFLFKQHGTGLWGRCWAVADGETVRWWGAKGHGGLDVLGGVAGGGIDYAGPPKRVVPLKLCALRDTKDLQPKETERGRWCFALVSAEGKGDGKPKLFQACSELDYVEWAGVLRAGVKHAQAGGAAVPAGEAGGGGAPPEARSEASRAFFAWRRDGAVGLDADGADGADGAPPLPRAELEHQLAAARAAGGNDVCADCGAAAPTCCALNLGLLVCTECSAAHRALGVHISKVRSLRHDALEPEAVAMLGAVGNATANSVLEAALASLDGVARPAADAPRAAREEWARRKYERRELCGGAPVGEGGGGVAAGGLAAGWEEVFDEEGNVFYYNYDTGVSQWERPSAEGADAPGGGADALCTAAAAGDWPSLLWQLWHVGVPINAAASSGGSALHAAVLAGQLDVAELLLQNGADAATVDAEGATPLCAAAAGGAHVPAGLLRRARLDDKMGALELAVARGDAALEEAIRMALGRQERSLTGAAPLGDGRTVSYCEAVPPAALLEPIPDSDAAPAGGVEAEPSTGSPLAESSSSERGSAERGSAERGSGGPRSSAKGGAFGLSRVMKRMGGSARTMADAASSAASSAGAAAVAVMTPRGSSGALTDALAALRAEFELPEADALLGRSACTNERAAPGMLSVTSSFVCFKPAQAGAPGTASSNARLDAAAAGGAATAGKVKLGVGELKFAERRQGYGKAARSKGYSIVLVDTRGGRHTFDGVLHCDMVLQLLCQAASALGVGSKREHDSVVFQHGDAPPLGSAVGADL